MSATSVIREYQPDSSTRYDVVNQDGYKIGSIRYFEVRGGWMFSTPIPGRRGGRTAFDTPEQAMPRWARGAELMVRL